MATDQLRDETRGQIFNELIRHRQIDEMFRNNSDDKNEVAPFGPILLFAFSTTNIEVDLAFPCNADGSVAKNGFVTFNEIHDKKRDAFWTVRLLRISIATTSKSKKNLPTVLQFLPGAIKIIDKWPQTRVQSKIPTPMPLTRNDTPYKYEDITEAIKFGDNATILTMENDKKLVFKNSVTSTFVTLMRSQ